MEKNGLDNLRLGAKLLALRNERVTEEWLKLLKSRRGLRAQRKRVSGVVEEVGRCNISSKVLCGRKRGKRWSQ